MNGVLKNKNKDYPIFLFNSSEENAYSGLKF